MCNSSGIDQLSADQFFDWSCSCQLQQLCSCQLHQLWVRVIIPVAVSHRILEKGENAILSLNCQFRQHTLSKQASGISLNEHTAVRLERLSMLRFGQYISCDVTRTHMLNLYYTLLNEILNVSNSRQIVL